MFDLIVIGGGPGGYAAAEHAARHGMAVALVERDRLGGTCLNRGCVPTKAYLHASQVAAEAAAFAPGMPAVFDRHAMYLQKNKIVDTLAQGIGTLMKAGKIAVYPGQGTLCSDQAPFSVRVTDKQGTVETLTGRQVLLATGSAPARLPVPGCDHPDVWTSDDLLGEAGATPFQSLLIVGGGVIGVEMATIYARLGVSVTVLEAEKRCLPMMDAELSRSAEMLLKGQGIAVITDARLQIVNRTSDGFYAIYEKGGAPVTVNAGRVLLATGRRPATDGLFGEGVAPRMERRCVAVDATYQTSLPGVYAIGDVNGLCPLAHAAHAQGIAAVSAMLGVPSPTDPTLVPSCVYTAPEIAAVGLTQDEATAQGHDAVVGKALTTQNARTLEDLVKEMLRPMLKSWLDDNLPAVVERLVRAEIERVSRGR